MGDGLPRPCDFQRRPPARTHRASRGGRMDRLRVGVRGVATSEAPNGTWVDEFFAPASRAVSGGYTHLGGFCAGRGKNLLKIPNGRPKF